MFFWVSPTFSAYNCVSTNLLNGKLGITKRNSEKLGKTQIIPEKKSEKKLSKIFEFFCVFPNFSHLSTYLVEGKLELNKII